MFKDAKCRRPRAVATSEPRSNPEHPRKKRNLSFGYLSASDEKERRAFFEKRGGDYASRGNKSSPRLARENANLREPSPRAVAFLLEQPRERRRAPTNYKFFLKILARVFIFGKNCKK